MFVFGLASGTVTYIHYIAFFRQYLLHLVDMFGFVLRSWSILSTQQTEMER